MKRHFIFPWITGLSLALALSGCRRAAPREVVLPAPPEQPAKREVIEQPPVETASFDAGFNEGYAAGRAAGKLAGRKAALPDENECARQASLAAGAESSRSEKWQKGFAQGYLDGFRLGAHNLK